LDAAERPVNENTSRTWGATGYAPSRGTMLVVLVSVHVKPEAVEAFKAATRANAAESVKEPGIARFDVLEQADDATRFVRARSSTR
jgi:hypothetical protein